MTLLDVFVLTHSSKIDDYIKMMEMFYDGLIVVGATVAAAVLALAVFRWPCKCIIFFFF